MRRCLALVLIVAACSGGGGGFDVTGTVTVNDAVPPARDGEPCRNDGGYEDVPDAQVKVVDDEGKTLAVADLESGRATRGSDLITICQYAFAIEDIDEGSNVYTFSLGRRGEVSYSAEDLAENGNTVELTLGD